MFLSSLKMDSAPLKPAHLTILVLRFGQDKNMEINVIFGLSAA